MKNKTDRIKIHNKFGGKCSYCGKQVEFKEMQVDHMMPKIAYEVGLYGKRLQWNHNLNDFENLMPSCRRCNHYKSDYSLEEFRRLIFTLDDRLKKHYINKVAIDFEMMVVYPFSGLFYFETIAQTKLF